MCIVGSVVECSPATRAARVRFPDDASCFLVYLFRETDTEHFTKEIGSLAQKLMELFFSILHSNDRDHTFKTIL